MLGCGETRSIKQGVNSVEAKRHTFSEVQKLRRKTHEEFLDQLKQVKGEEFEVLSKYVNDKTKIKIRHKICGTVFYPTPNNLIRKSGCPICARKSYGKHKTHTPEEFKEMFYSVFPKDYELISDYKLSTEKVIVKHLVCGNIYKVLPGNLIHKRSGCPFCMPISKGELMVERLLKSKGVSFKQQYSFEDCVYKTKLKFDFAIFDKNNNLKGLIEYDGEQHFKPKERFGGKEEFIKTKERDHVKNEYCRNKNIKLLRIPYWKKDSMEEIIYNFLKRIMCDAC